jgi:hypothetical protein
VMRQVLSCHTAEGIDLVPDRIFVGPETVLSPTEISSLTRLALRD